jgi:uncharacterized protein involved in oxidation of intracellular sulfur
MQLAIILSTQNAETNWNALRLANFALEQGDTVRIFLVGEGVEYLPDRQAGENGDSEKFKIQELTEKFLASEKAQILACGMCLKSRNKEGTPSCPLNSLKDLYALVKESDKILTF